MSATIQELGLEPLAEVLLRYFTLGRGADPQSHDRRGFEQAFSSAFLRVPHDRLRATADQALNVARLLEARGRRSDADHLARLIELGAIRVTARAGHTALFAPNEAFEHFFDPPTPKPRPKKAPPQKPIVRAKPVSEALEAGWEKLDEVKRLRLAELADRLSELAKPAIRRG